MSTVEKIGGWLLLAGGLVYLGEMVIRPLRQFDAIGRVLVTAGAAAWIVGHVA